MIWSNQSHGTRPSVRPKHIPCRTDAQVMLALASCLAVSVPRFMAPVGQEVQPKPTAVWAAPMVSILPVPSPVPKNYGIRTPPPVPKGPSAAGQYARRQSADTATRPKETERVRALSSDASARDEARRDGVSISLHLHGFGHERARLSTSDSPVQADGDQEPNAQQQVFDWLAYPCHAHDAQRHGRSDSRDVQPVNLLLELLSVVAVKRLHARQHACNKSFFKNFNILTSSSYGEGPLPPARQTKQEACHLPDPLASRTVGPQIEPEETRIYYYQPHPNIPLMTQICMASYILYHHTS